MAQRSSAVAVSHFNNLRCPSCRPPGEARRQALGQTRGAMRVWNGADARAVVATASTFAASEVLSGMPHLVIASPGALCVGVYNARSGAALPLRYVPPGLARAGVPAGWYAPARRGMPFAVAVTPTMRCAKVSAGFHAHALVADVAVDGVPANPRGRVVDPASKADYVVLGFVLEREIRRGLIFKRVREFRFERDVATVQLRVRGAVRGRKREIQEDAQSYEGRGEDDGVTRKVIRKCRQSGYVMLGLWDMPQFAIDVRLRTEEWLKKQGILEDDFVLNFCDGDMKKNEDRFKKDEKVLITEDLLDGSSSSAEKVS